MGKGRGSIIFGRSAPLIFRVAGITAAFVILLVVLALVFSGSISPTSSIEYSAIIRRGTLRVGVRADVPGFALDGEGLEIDIARELASEFFPDSNGSALSLVTMSSSMMSANISDETVDCVIMLAPINQSTGQYAYSEAYYTDSCVLAGMNSVPDAPAGSVGVISDSVEQTRLSSYRSENGLDFNIAAYPTYETLFLALRAGDVNSVALRGAFLGAYGDEYSLIGGLEFGSVDYAVACSVDSPAIAEMASIVIDRLRQSGELEAMIARHGL